MRDVNHVARSRSHHRQRTDSVPGRSRTPHHPAPPRQAPQRPAQRPAAGRSPAKHVARTPPKSTRRPSAPARGRQARNAQPFRKRAVSKHQARIYKAGQSSRRLVAVFVIAAVLFLAVLARVTLLQTVQADALRLAGKSQRTTQQLLKAHRGTIFDRNGAVRFLFVEL